MLFKVFMMEKNIKKAAMSYLFHLHILCRKMLCMSSQMLEQVNLHEHNMPIFLGTLVICLPGCNIWYDWVNMLWCLNIHHIAYIIKKNANGDFWIDC